MRLFFAIRIVTPLLAIALVIGSPALLLADVPIVDEGLHEAGGHGPETPLALSADLMFWSGVVFLLFLVLLWKLAWKPMTTALDSRECRIREDIAAAESSRVKAEAMLSEHAAKLDRVQDEVKAILAEARRDAETARHNIMADATAEAEATKTRALGEIERAKDQVLKELFDHFAGRVADATEHVLGRGLTSGDQDRLIAEALDQFESRVPATRA